MEIACCHHPSFFGMLSMVIVAYNVLGFAYSSRTSCSGTFPWHSIVKIHQGKCYEFIRTERFWDDASRDCWSKGGSLLQIRNHATQMFVMGSLRKLHWGRNGLWIGAHDSNTEGHWQWVTGERLTWSFWEPGQPSCHLRWMKIFCAEDCAVLRINEGGRWHDYRCHSIGFVYSYICQYEMIKQTTELSSTSTSKPRTASISVTHPRTMTSTHSTSTLSEISSSSFSSAKFTASSLETDARFNESSVSPRSPSTPTPIAVSTTATTTKAMNDFRGVNSTSLSILTELYSEDMNTSETDNSSVWWSDMMNITDTLHGSEGNASSNRPYVSTEEMLFSPSTEESGSSLDYDAYNDLPAVVAARRADSPTTTSYTGLTAGIILGVFILCGILVAALVYHRRASRSKDDLWAVGFDNPNYGRRESQPNEHGNVNEVIYEACGDVHLFQPDTMDMRSEECTPDVCESSALATSVRFENPYAAMDFSGRDGLEGSGSPKLGQNSFERKSPKCGAEYHQTTVKATS